MTALQSRLAAVVGAGLILAAPAAAWGAPRRPIDVGPNTTTTTALTTAAPSAHDERNLESRRSRCVAAIDDRFSALAAAKAALAAASHVTDDHRAALTALLDDTTTRLQALQGEITADTEVSSLKAHCRSVFHDNRVFGLVLPRTRLVVASDVSGALADKLDEVAEKLSAAIAEAEAAGLDVTQAKAHLEAMKTKIASGRALAASVPGAVLGLTPADWNADHSVLAPARQALQSARSDLRGARELAGQVRDELKPKPQA
jgi:hypothetical protein